MEDPMFINFKEKFKKLITIPILKSEGGQVLRKVENGWTIENDQPTTKLILSGDLLEKGKAGQVGEIREWSGVKYKKVQSGKWAPVTEGKTKKDEETPKGEGRKSEGVGVDFSSFSDEKLKKYARSANSQALKKHAEGSDEKVRVIAKEELSRREKEENPDYEAPKEEVEKGKGKKETKAKGTTDKKDTKTGSKVKENKEKPKEVKGEVSLYDKEWNDLNSEDFNQLLRDHSDYVEAKGGNIKAPIKDFLTGKENLQSGKSYKTEKRK